VEIQDASTGTLINAFTGTLHVLLLREKPLYTLANDASSYVTSFKTWGDTLYDGNVAVTNGTFSFSFTIPAGASPYYHASKFSFYAKEGTTDASGCYTNLVVGNILQAVPELSPPSGEVAIYPNPVSDVATFHLSSTQASPLNLYIYDSEGRKVKTEENILHPDFSVNVSELAKSMYWFTLENTRHEVIYHGKIAVQ